MKNYERNMLIIGHKRNDNMQVNANKKNINERNLHQKENSEKM